MEVFGAKQTKPITLASVIPTIVHNVNIILLNFVTNPLHNLLLANFIAISLTKGQYHYTCRSTSLFFVGLKSQEAGTLCVTGDMKIL